MEAKLKLVLALIPWSLVARGAAFGLAWLFLPYAFFLAVAAFLFFQPPFQAWRFLPLLLLLASFAWLLPSSVWAAFLLSLLFGVIVGVKNLVLVDREFSAELFLVVASFLLWFIFFSTQTEASFLFFLKALGIISLHFLLFRFMFQVGHTEVLATGFFFLLMLFSLLALQFVWVLSLLPLLPSFSALLLALFSGVFWEFLLDYFVHTLNPEKTKVVLLGFSLLVFLFLLPAFSSLT